jgi:hypothetical protein
VHQARAALQKEAGEASQEDALLWQGQMPQGTLPV